MKSKIRTLRDNIINNKIYLSEEYQSTYAILSDLNRMISFDMNHSLMFQWWVENEDSIDTINRLLEKIEK